MRVHAFARLLLGRRGGLEAGRVGRGGGHGTCPSVPHGTAVPVTGSRKVRRCLSFTWVGVRVEG